MDSRISFQIQRPLTRGERFFLKRELDRTGTSTTEKSLQAGNYIELPNTKTGRDVQRNLQSRLN